MLVLLLAALLQDDLKPEKAETMFVEGYLAYSDGDHEESTRLFMRIYLKFPSEPVGAIAAYNIACNCSLDGAAEKSLEWLKKALDGGYDNFDHLESDSDLDSIREEKKYEEMLAAAKKKAGEARRAPLKEDEAKKFADRLSTAYHDEDQNTIRATFSRLSWFSHAKTIEWINAELTKKGLKLEGSGTGVQIVKNDQ